MCEPQICLQIALAESAIHGTTSSSAHSATSMISHASQLLAYMPEEIQWD